MERIPNEAEDVIMYQVTKRCNNGCFRICYFYGSREIGPDQTVDEIKEKINKSTHKRVTILSGGEPTERPEEELLDIIRTIKSHDPKTYILLYTNGRNFANDPKLIKKLNDAGLDGVQVTIFSYNPDQHNKVTGKMGSWGETISGVNNLIKSGCVDVMTNTVVLPENTQDEHDLEKTIYRLYLLGVRDMTISQLQIRGLALKHKAYYQQKLKAEIVNPCLARAMVKAKELGIGLTINGFGLAEAAATPAIGSDGREISDDVEGI